MVVLAASIVGALAVALALPRPLLFPFGLFVLLVPFDNLLGTGSSGTITKLLAIASIVCLLLWIARHRIVFVRERSVVLLALLLVWMGASVLWALDQQAALTSLATDAGLFALYVIVSMTPVSARTMKTLLGLVIVGGVFAAAYGANYAIHNAAFIDGAADARLVIRSGSVHIDPNAFADALLLPAALATMWTLRTSHLLLKAVGAAAIAMLTIAVLLTGSREALFALAALLIYLFARSSYRAQLGSVGIVLGLIGATVQTSMWNRLSIAISTGGAGRTSIWRVGIEAAKHRLLQGYGIGNFRQAYDLYYLSVRQPYPYGFDSPAHNLVISSSVELGIVGLVLIAAFLCSVFASMRVVRAESPWYDYRIALEGALIAIAIVSLAIDLFSEKYTWLALLMVALLRNAALEDHASAEIRWTSASMMPARSTRS